MTFCEENFFPLLGGKYLMKFLGSFEVIIVIVTSKVLDEYQYHILVAFLKSFHLICDMTIFDYLHKLH